jgi:hypothetical protein
MSPGETRARTLPMIAGILILCNTAALGVAATWFPGVIPTLPGSKANDTTVLYRLTAVGLIFGALVLIGAILLRTKPANRRVWSIMVMVFSIASVITGGGFIIGFILGTIGGASAWKLEVQSIKPAATTT